MPPRARRAPPARGRRRPLRRSDRCPVEVQGRPRDQGLRHRRNMSAPMPMPPILRSCARSSARGHGDRRQCPRASTTAPAARCLASEEAVAEHDLSRSTRIVACGHAGVDPNFMGMGLVPATRAALVRPGCRSPTWTLIGSNEAFAAQACAVSDALGFDPAKVNPNGSGISLGALVDATGADPSSATKLVPSFARVGGRYGLATMCIGGGRGLRWWWRRVRGASRYPAKAGMPFNCHCTQSSTAACRSSPVESARHRIHPHHRIRDPPRRNLPARRCRSSASDIS